MYSLRFLALGILLSSPFFSFAQTATTTEDQPVDPQASLQGSIDQLTKDRLKSLTAVADSISNSISDKLSVVISPKNPPPLVDVRITIESFLTDLNRASITWSLNGKSVLSGIGKTSFLFKNGPAGKTTSILISITTSTGEHVTKTISLNPIGVSTLWEADTYTPPFYKGKPLLSSQAKVRVVAFPDNTQGDGAVNPGSLVYTWEQDGEINSRASGYGKNSYTFIGPKPFDSTNLRVRASTISNAVSSDTEVRLTLVQPFILFYEKQPLLGTWYNNPLSRDFTLSKKELSVSAEPYFFSNESSEAPALLYNWSLNGRKIQSTGRTITLRNENNEKGSSSLALAMRGINQTFQSASQSLRIRFTADESSRPIF